MAMLLLATTFLASTAEANRRSSSESSESSVSSVSSVSSASSQSGDEANPLFDGCPDFLASYSTCTKTAGTQPEFFESVTIAELDDRYQFSTVILPGFGLDVFVNQYFPDRIVRLGSDSHTLPDGTFLQDLTTHESSRCEDGVLFHSEITFLPDNTIAQGLLTFELSADAQTLFFEAEVDGVVELAATCTA